MRRPAIFFLLSTLACGWAWAGGNQSSAGAVTAVKIVRPIALRKTQDLWFGALLVDPGAADRKIKQHAGIGGGTREPDPPGVTQVALGSEHWRNAEFEIQGEPEASFYVTLPAGAVQIPNTTGAGPGLTLYLDVPKFNYYVDNSIGTDGKTTMWIGGQLNLTENPSPGHYRAQFPVTVTYY